MNRIKTTMLLAGLTALFIYAGSLWGGKSGLIFALFFTGIMNLVSYWYSDKIVLRMQRAIPVTPSEEPDLYRVVSELAQRGHLPMPKIYVIPEQTPNAFATGRNPSHAAVAVTQGLLEMLNHEELKGVIAHELGHVKNRDTLIMTVTATMAGALSMIASMARWGMLLGGGRSRDSEEGGNPIAGLIGILVAPLAAALIQMAISRTREYDADFSGAHSTGQPLALASALQKIETYSKRIPMHNAVPATAHMYIINPLVGGGFAQLFSTHPSTQERIKRLQELATRADLLTTSV